MLAVFCRPLFITFLGPCNPEPELPWLMFLGVI